MITQDFSHLQSSGLLRDVEELVVDGHRRMHERHGMPWTAPQAYRWLRYEDPDPVARLASGVRKLRKMGLTFEAGAVDKACARASKTGDLS